jgi:hypothetical protein
MGLDVKEKEFEESMTRFGKMDTVRKSIGVTP